MYLTVCVFLHVYTYVCARTEYYIPFHHLHCKNAIFVAVGHFEIESIVNNFANEKKKVKPEINR